jgi:hypothetical protein
VVCWVVAEVRVLAGVLAALAGLLLGLVLDGLHLGPISQIPPLMLLGWWWGRMGRKGLPIERSFSLGLLALLGSAFVGLTLILQLAVVGELQGPVLYTWLGQTLLTALLAPMVCSLQLLLWRQQVSGGRR